MQKIQNFMRLTEQEEYDLKVNFLNAMKNQKFRDLVEKYPASEELLMKYTSSLMDSATDFSNCSSCPGLESCKNQVCGYIMTPVIGKKSITFDYVACSHLQTKLKKEEYLNNIELFQISKSVRNASIKNIDTKDKERLKILRYFKDFLDQYDDDQKPKGLYLNGSFGTGKTYLVSSLLNELAKRGVHSAIVYYPEFLRNLKESFDTDYKEKFNYIRKVPVLLIDDIGAESLSTWNRDEILGSILQFRMEENLPTFFTSNLTLDELEEHLSLTNRGVEKVKARRIIERIEFMCIEMKLISKNRRKKETLN